MKRFFVLRESSKVSEIRTAFFQEGVFVKKGLELSLLTYVLNSFVNESRELFSNRIQKLKEESFFYQHPYVKEDVFKVFSVRTLEEEYIRFLIHSHFLKEGKYFLNQERIKELKDSLKLSFVKKSASNNYYEEDTLKSIERYALKDFFYLLSDARKTELRRSVLC